MSATLKPAETILVVDDDQEVLSLAVDVLQMARYVVLSTDDPRHAIRLAKTHPETIHVLLSDVVMPIMNGVQLAAEITAIRPDIRVLLMSAYRTQAIDDYRTKTPGALFLDKPFTVAGLLQAVQSTLKVSKAGSWPRPT
jgi:two-component system cell cycle sensor histidine kinase/response regulator CckA